MSKKSSTDATTTLWRTGDIRTDDYCVDVYCPRGDEDDGWVSLQIIDSECGNTCIDMKMAEPFLSNLIASLKKALKESKK